MRPSRAWIALLAVAGALAAIAVGHWLDALVTGRPVLYGEGAVANAAILLREGNPYMPRSEFVAANYPPLYLLLAGVADPFRAGRLVTIAAALAVAVVLWWRARAAGRIPSVALALTWLALAPVAIWGAAVKPDMLAVVLTLGGVAALDRALWPGLAPADRRLALAGGALLAAAVWAKPTAVLPAAAVLVYALLVARPVAARALAGALAVGTIALVHASTLGLGDVWRHVVVWNALPWSAEQAFFVVAIGLATLGLVIAVALRSGALGGVALAYVIGAGGVVLLGGREGATINYLLDVAAAALYAIACVAPRVSTSTAVPIALAAQCAMGFAVLAPFGLLPGRDAGTGAWSDREVLSVVRALPGPRQPASGRSGPHLVEDSGFQIAAGQRPIVDDLFLWSRLVARGAIDPAGLLDRVRAADFATVLSEVDLAQIDHGPQRERARWHPLLVQAVLERYEEFGDRIAGPRVWTYRPR